MGVIKEKGDGVGVARGGRRVSRVIRLACHVERRTRV